MNFDQKPVGEQTIVITGATSGIGLVTARMAARRGARLMLIARNEEALQRLSSELETEGTDVRYHAADVADEGELKRASTDAINAFGGFDTWVNNAGVSIYGHLDEVREEDSRRLFDTNFWGSVNGSLIASRQLRGRGGTIVNIGSTLSDRAIPIQGMYSASKHAVKGFTDALRMELEAQDAPIYVTLVKPAAIDTPYKQHAKNYMDVEPKNPAPVYAPETVAETILYCAENPVRDVFVGAGGKMLSFLGGYAPRLTDRYMENVMIEGQKTNKKSNGRTRESLYEPNDPSLNERGGYAGHVAESSLYTKASLHPIATGASIAVCLGGAYAIRKYFQRAKGLPVENS